jgi:hypothetical protein
VNSLRLAFFCVAALLLVVGCDDGSDPQTTTSTTTTIAGSTELFGEVTSIADDEQTLTVELAEMLTGEEARQAAVEAGVIEPGEDLPNDFFIRSLDSTEEFELAEDAEITLQGFNAGVPGPVPVTREEFVDAFVSRFAAPEWYGGDFYEMTASGDMITRLEQIYLP